MATAWDCTDPKEAWDLVAHFVGNLLCAGIGLKLSRLKEVQTDDERDRLENEFSRTRATLIGFLFVLGRQMHKHSNEDMAHKIDTLLDAVVTEDVTNPAILEQVAETYKRLGSM